MLEGDVQILRNTKLHYFGPPPEFLYLHHVEIRIFYSSPSSQSTYYVFLNSFEPSEHSGTFYKDSIDSMPSCSQIYLRAHHPHFQIQNFSRIYIPRNPHGAAIVLYGVKAAFTDTACLHLLHKY